MKPTAEAMITPEREEALRLCPFCSGESAMILLPDSGMHCVSCVDCGAEGPVHESAQEAVAAWNDRHSAPQQERRLVAWQALIPPYADHKRTTALVYDKMELGHIQADIEWIELYQLLTPHPAHSAPQQEPVAWIADIPGYADHRKVKCIVFSKDDLRHIKDGVTVWTPLYAAPPAAPDAKPVAFLHKDKGGRFSIPDLSCRSAAENSEDYFPVFRATSSEPDVRFVGGIAPSHWCKVCGALWRQWGDGSWNLRSRECGKCCDNVAMAEQIDVMGAPTLASDYTASSQPDVVRDAMRWNTLCNLWAASTILELRQTEEGFWSITQIEDVEGERFKRLIGEDPDDTIDSALQSAEQPRDPTESKP